MRDGSRARELLPNILLTLLSVVQALALEALWSAVRESPWLSGGGVTAWVCGLQAVAVFVGIVVIWLFYIGIVMRFTWMPATRDSIAPFVLGAGELSLIGTMQPGLLHYWFFILAAIFVFSVRISNAMLGAGMADPANRPVLTAPKQNPVERWVSYLAAALLVACGVGVLLVGEDGAFAIVCVLLANLLLIGQGLVIQHYWRQWVGASEAS